MHYALAIFFVFIACTGQNFIPILYLICVLFHVKQKPVRRDMNVSRETFTVTIPI